jgi:hypothetical protein
VVEMTTTKAAAYLAEQGCTIGRPYRGGSGPISPRTLREWCRLGKLKGVTQSGHGNRSTWLIPQSELDRLLERVTREREGQDE